MPREHARGGWRTYIVHVPLTAEYAELNALLSGGEFPGGSRSRSRFIREVLQYALGFAREPTYQRLAGSAAGEAQPASRGDPPREPPRARDARIEALLRRSLQHLEDNTGA